jgi:hypothetical protein
MAEPHDQLARSLQGEHPPLAMTANMQPFLAMFTDLPAE